MLLFGLVPRRQTLHTLASLGLRFVLRRFFAESAEGDGKVGTYCVGLLTARPERVAEGRGV